MEDRDVMWAQKVVDRWSIKKGVPAPKVTTISTSDENTLSGYQNSTIILNERALDKEDLAGKILLLADPFGYHIQCALGHEPDEEKADELARELVVYEVELWSDATGVQMRQLMKIKTISKLMSLLEPQPTRR
jgi:hypothetical protein